MKQQRPGLKERLIRSIMKYFSLTDLLLFIAGIAVSFGGFAASGFDYTMFYNNTIYPDLPVEVRETDIPACIEIYTQHGDVKIQGADAFTVSYDENGVSAAWDGDVYQLNYLHEEGWNAFTQNWYRVINNSYSANEYILLSIPADYSGEILIRSDYGAVDVTSLAGDAVLDVEAGNGVVTLDSISAAGDVTLVTTHGDIRLSDVASEGTVTLESTHGKIELKAVAFAALTADNNHGRTVIQEARGETCAVTAQNGRVELEGVTMDGSLSAVCTHGRIEVDGIFAPNITLFSDNGSVKGSIAGPEAYFTWVLSVDSLDGAGDHGSDAAVIYGSKHGSADIRFSG